MPQHTLSIRTVTAKDKTYRKFRVRWLDGAGKWRERTFNTKTERARFMETDEFVEADLSGHDAGEITVHKAVAIWLHELEIGADGNPPREPVTLQSYRGHFDHRIFPFLDTHRKTKLSQITSKTMKDLRQHLLDTCTSRTTAKGAYERFSSFLRWCAGDGELLRAAPSDMKGIKLDQRKGARIKVFSEAEMQSLRDAVTRLENSKWPQVRTAWSERYRLMFYILTTTGMRISEVLGVQFDDFTDDFSLLHIQRRISKHISGVPHEDMVGNLKTRNSRRDAGIVASLRDEIRTRKQQANSPYLFPSRDGGFLTYRNILTRMWVPLIKEANVPPLGIHSLRHYYASVLISKGVNIMEVSRHLGHHSVQFTMDTYGHLLPDRARERAALLTQVEEAMMK